MLWTSSNPCISEFTYMGSGDMPPLRICAVGGQNSQVFCGVLEMNEYDQFWAHYPKPLIIILNLQLLFVIQIPLSLHIFT